MKILSVSDKIEKQLLNQGNDLLPAPPDIILACGDLPPEYLTELREIYSVPLYFIEGNHDIRYHEAPPVGCTNIHAKIITEQGLRIMGFSGSRWYNGGINQYTEAQMKKNIRSLWFQLLQLNRVDIIISHAPPRFIHDEEDPCHKGFRGFVSLIKKQQPVWFIHGHIHSFFKNPAGRVTQVCETKVINSYGFFSLKQNWWKNKQESSQTSGNANSLSQETNFDQVRESEKAYETVKRGTATVPLDKIKGSVGRYTDFDQQFRLKGAGSEERLGSLILAMQEGRSIPPVSLYQIKDNFYIVDGHHRVTAARELGQSHIQAKILELLPSNESVENRLYLEKIELRDKVGIPKVVDFTEPGQSEYLLEQVTMHQSFLAEESQKKVDLKEAGSDWYRSIYLPLKTLIKNSGLLRSFPDRTMDDLYLYISTHQWQKESRRQYGIGVDKLIPRDMEAFRRKMARTTDGGYPEMKRDITIFILINVDGTQEQRILDKLFALPEVVELHSVHGSIDLVVKATLTRDLLASDAEVISQFTHSSLRCIKGIISTQTLIPGLSLVKPQG